METILLALERDCPFCGATAGEPCRARNSGKEQPYPHSRRIELTRTPEELLRYAPVYVDALCCVCGNKRTVSSKHGSGTKDPNLAHTPLGTSQGWRFTQTLKCSACGEQTRHAVLRPAAASYRDSDEEQQRIALGDPDTGPYGDLTDLARIRREYREMPFPRNPHLTHRRFTLEAERAWDDGTKVVTALCGEPLKIDRDPRETQKYSKDDGRNEDGYVIAEVVSDIEITDHETGLSWIHMDCVDCCRVSNRLNTERWRRCLGRLLYNLSVNVDKFSDDQVADVLDYLRRMSGEKQ